MSKKADALAALKEARIEETEAAIAKLNANLEEGKVTVTNPKSGTQTRKNMTAEQRTKKQEQRDKLAVKLAQLKGLMPKASRARSSKSTQMKNNLASDSVLYCYKATPEGKRGAELDGALIGEDYVSAAELMTRWGKKTAVKPTASRGPSRSGTRASSPTGGPGHEGGARRRRTMRRKASRKARKASRKASRKARKSMRRSRKH